MTGDWLGGADGVLVTVAASKGSVPREPGAKMLVRANDFDGTIGGGHLEHRALELARAMLHNGDVRRFERFALGPSLGQCCGGVAWLAFERADAEQMAVLRARRNDDTWRMVALDGAHDWALFDAAGARLAGMHDTPGVTTDQTTRVIEGEGARRWLVDAILAPRAHLMLFGAGHVGAAIVRTLSELPCRVTWVDERDDLFPQQVPGNVTVEVTDTPETLIENAAPGTTFLVMTHSHALDLRLCHAILARPCIGQQRDWFGLIGSATKRTQFEARLRERGVLDTRIADMVCPIGLPGIAGKAPAVIAASCAAQLLSVWEAAKPQEQPEYH